MFKRETHFGPTFPSKPLSFDTKEMSDIYSNPLNRLNQIKDTFVERFECLTNETKPKNKRITQKLINNLEIKYESIVVVDVFPEG